ncbi:unnamed protein product [Triticum turgidum subsp. durum]|uniref:ACT domain-containing protein n=1 Tax=Triticum turgidum subsp. durum TaxID=4567 RepID=A0A9R0SB18_TRITD|nr:unnamed protein product [Triticum turgidum subsp. durum]
MAVVTNRLHIQFLREQAALSAAEITADAVNNFVADLEDESDSEQLIPTTQNEDYKFNWQKILSSNKLSFVNKNSDGFLPVNNVHMPKINGKHNKTVKELGIKINGSTVRGDSSTEFMRPGVPAYKEVFASLDNWKCGKISSWHNTEGNSIQWLCIVCVDRKGMMAEVTSALTACGITICSCVAERDNRRGMGVLLFHFEGTDENVVSACSSVEMILGVLGWSAGCSYNPLGVLEC